MRGGVERREIDIVVQRLLVQYPEFKGDLLTIADPLAGIQRDVALAVVRRLQRMENDVDLAEFLELIEARSSEAARKE